MVEAHIHAAEALGEVVETGEIHLGEVVDGLAGQVAHRPGGLPASLTARALQLGLVRDALLEQFVLGLSFGQP